MSQEEQSTSAGVSEPTTISPREDALRRYEARLGVWRIILGTLAVGVISALVSAAVTITTTMIEDSRKQSELRAAKEQAHQTYIKEFLTTGLNQDIELRLRLANYFAFLSGDDQGPRWKSYYTDLQRQRDDRRKQINELEAELAEQLAAPDRSNPVKLDEARRRLAWAYSEVGYVPVERSVVAAGSDIKDRLKKERLYRETKDIVKRLADSNVPIRADAVEHRRFWDLYRKDLIGVESQDVAAGMIALGRELEAIAGSAAPPGTTFRKLADDLIATIDRELRREG